MILDTNMIIDFLKGKNEAVTLINTFEGVLGTTTITVFELYPGILDEEREQITEFLDEHTFLNRIKNLQYVVEI